MATSDDKSLPDQAVEAILYAPLGIALDVLDRLPTWVARGKSQATLTRLVGKMAVQKGQSEIEGVVSDIFGVKLGAPSSEESDGSDKPDNSDTSETSETSAKAKPAAQPKSAKPAKETPAKDTKAAKPKSKKTAKKPKAVLAEDLALESYGTLTASQIVKRLDALSAKQLESVRLFEEANRHRVTILNRIRQIQRAS